MDEENASSDCLASDNFEEFYSKLQGVVLGLTRNAATLPTDINFHRSMDSGFSQELDMFSSRVLSLSNNILGLVTVADAGGSKTLRKLRGLDDIVDHFHPLLVDPVDHLLEQVDICLDEFSGSSLPIAIAVSPLKVVPKVHNTFPAPVIQHAPNIQKPQLLFKNKIDNTGAPWYPTLHHKYHAKVPLGHLIRDSDSEQANISNSTIYHPYYYEITHLVYPERVYHPSTPVQPNPLSSTPFTWVSTASDFQSMLKKLQRAKEVAVDLEYHNYRSYAGFVCLMQVSTREEDWVVDTLVLREEMEELGEVFANPEIIKVFHGAESDIVWLQQDFNLYIVNLFDTFHASKVLDFPRHGLANLLEITNSDISSLIHYQSTSTRNASICTLRHTFLVIHIR
ncbi:ribonuclease H-like domain-containing protein [Infundibulicybe gibba]|nr:ribonuclease H-like domain-containing protein [Infundibulicybe gibba]